MSQMKERILVAMSGGVDSSVAALLLKQANYEVIGLFLRNGVKAPENEIRSHKQGCCSVSDANDARSVATKLDIPFYSLDYKDQFDKLINYFVDSYNKGETPSPCVLCNQWLKFGSLLKFAKEIGATSIATGHYARCEKLPTGRYALKKALDPNKDQSYFLSSLNQTQLASCKFPIGHLTKPEVREIARSAELRTAEKPESMEICFVPDGNYRNFINERTPGTIKPGLIIDEIGTEVGRHNGIQGFTIGQRKGLGIIREEPVYVTKIDSVKNLIQIGSRSSLARTELMADRIVWGSIEPYEGSIIRCEVRIRHHHTPAKADVTVLSHNRINVHFDNPQDSIAPGQTIALYNDELIIAGGWIL